MMIDNIDTEGDDREIIEESGDERLINIYNNLVLDKHEYTKK